MWKEITEHDYDQALGVLPPALMTGIGFLLGEAFDHRYCRITDLFLPTYAAYVHWDGCFFAGPHLTVHEFRRVKLSDVLCALS